MTDKFKLQLGSDIIKKAIILAAGEGSRMKSSKSKVLHMLLFKPLIMHVFDSVKNAGFDEIITVLGTKNIDEAAPVLEAKGSKIVKQELGEGKPYGTGYAVKLAKDFIKEEDSLMVLYGDTPLIDSKVIEEFTKFHNEEKSDITVLSAILDDPKDYGRIVRENGEFSAIVEKKELNPNKTYTNEVNSGIYLFSGKAFLKTIDLINDNNLKKEYMITDTIKYAKEMGMKVSAYVTSDTDIILGVNDREDLYFCERALIKRENRKRMLSGVMIHNPDLTMISPDVKIEQDVEIFGECKIYGETVIESGTIIESSTLKNMKIGKDCHIINTVAEDSVVGNNVSYGPFSRIRPNSVIKDGVKVGNFVEVKNSTLGEGTKAGHLAYIGDADVGKGVNISCGVIFCNYDGKHKHRTVVGDNAFIGSNVNLVAPVEVSNNGFVAAGSTITKPVEEDELAIERSEQKNIKEWVKKKGLHKEDF